MISVIDFLDKNSGSELGVFSNTVMYVIMFFFSATAMLFVNYPPSYFKKKYDMYRLSKRMFVSGEHQDDFTFLELAIRYVKQSVGLSHTIVKGERALKGSVDVGMEVIGTKDVDLVAKYWPFAPGLTFDQKNDGIHVHVMGDDHECTLMSSLGYWGFHVNPEIREFAFQKVRETGTGNHGSYLLLGKNQVVDESYEAMKKFFKRKYCSYAASGFLACMNLVASLAPKGGIIFMDEKCHVCLRHGSKLSGAKTIKFPHQNYTALEKLMKKYRHKYSGRALLVVDAIYSADGTIAKLPEGRKLCDKYNVEIVMDEAHSLGTLGATGHGIEEHFNMFGACDYICGVFSKTLSSYGGFVVSDREDVKTLTITPGVGFATGPHSFSAATVTKALQIIEEDNGKTRAAIDKMRLYYVEQLKKAKCMNIVHCGHNVFVSYPHAFAACTVSVEMRKRGYLISSFMFPSVPIDRSILRLSLTPLTTTEILDGFCKTLGEVMVDLIPRFGEEVIYGEQPEDYFEPRPPRPALKKE